MSELEILGEETENPAPAKSACTDCAELVEALRFVHEHIADPARGFRDLYPAFGLDSGQALEMVASALAKHGGGK